MFFHARRLFNSLDLYLLIPGSDHLLLWALHFGFFERLILGIHKLYVLIHPCS